MTDAIEMQLVRAVQALGKAHAVLLFHSKTSASEAKARQLIVKHTRTAQKLLSEVLESLQCPTVSLPA